MEQSFEKGTYVVYGKSGVCLVEDRKTVAFSGRTGEYYVLLPLGDSCSTVYVPCENRLLISRMRPLLSRDELEKLLAGLADTRMEWIEDKNERMTALQDVMNTGDRGQLVLLIRCIYEKKQEKTATGKHLASADERLLQEAVRLLEEEIALVMDIAPDEVPAYIRSRLERE